MYGYKVYRNQQLVIEQQPPCFGSKAQASSAAVAAITQLQEVNNGSSNNDTYRIEILLPTLEEILDD